MVCMDYRPNLYDACRSPLIFDDEDAGGDGECEVFLDPKSGNYLEVSIQKSLKNRAWDFNPAAYANPWHNSAAWDADRRHASAVF